MANYAIVQFIIFFPCVLLLGLIKYHPIQILAGVLADANTEQQLDC